METKKCSKCGVVKSLNDFYIEKRVKDGFYSRCKPCQNNATIICRMKNPNLERRRESVRAWRAANPENGRDYKMTCRTSWEPLLSTPRWCQCQICGAFRVDTKIDLHHLNPKTRLFTVACAMRDRIFPDQIILFEMEKCISLCRPCHTKVHHTGKKQSPKTIQKRIETQKQNKRGNI